MPVIEVQGLVKRYGDMNAVAGVFTVEELSLIDRYAVEGDLSLRASSSAPG